MAEMRLPKLYPIIDTGSLAVRGARAFSVAEAFVQGGARIVQLRHKGQWTRDDFHEARSIADLCRAESVQLIINDRADIAALLGAGVHLGQDDLPPGEARKVVGDAAVIGFSTHNPDQFQSAAGEPVDYLALGPIFPTHSKDRPDPVVGVQQLRNCRKWTDRPVVAIGGITLENARSLLDSGADSVAVISGLLTDDCSPHTLRERMEEWQRHLRE